MLLAPLPIAARSGGTLATASRPSTALSTPVASPRRPSGTTSRHGARVDGQPVAGQLRRRRPRRAAPRSGTGPPAGGGRCRTQVRRDHAGAGPRDDQQADAAHSPAPRPSCATVGTNDDIPMMPSPSVSEPEGRAAEARSRAAGRGRPAGCGDPPLDERRTRRQRQHGQHRQHDGRRVDAVATLGQRGHQQGDRGHQQDQARDVDAARVRGRRLGDPPQADGQQQQRAPAPRPTAYVSRQPVPTSRAAARIAPAVMPRPTLAPQIEVACTRAGPGAKSWASTASPQARTAAPPTPSSTRAATNSSGSCATAQTQRADGQRAEPGDVHPAAAVGVAEHAGGEQGAGEADDHRAQDPGAGHRRRRRGRRRWPAPWPSASRR